MAISYHEIEQARVEALRQLRIADKATRHAAELCSGRLRVSDIPEWTLKELKKELSKFNAHTGKWKD